MTDKKKGLPVLAWVGIGCGALLLMGVCAIVGGGWYVGHKVKKFAAEAEKNPEKTAAKLMIQMNPTLELISTDDEAGTISFRNKESGEEVTLSFKEVAGGKGFHLSGKTKDGNFDVSTGGDEESKNLTIKTDKGVMKFGAGGETPDWIPSYPGAEGVKSTFSTKGPDGEVGGFGFKTNDDPVDVAAFYKRGLEAAGFAMTVESTTKTANGTQKVMAAVSKQPARQVNIVVTVAKGGTAVAVQYSAKP